MVKKCLVKFESFDFERGIDVKELIIKIIELQKYYNKIDNTSYNIDTYIITLKVIHE